MLFLDTLIGMKIISKDTRDKLSVKFTIDSLESPRGQELAKKINEHFDITDNSTHEWPHLDQTKLMDFVNNVELTRQPLRTSSFASFVSELVKIAQDNDDWKESWKKFCIEYAK